MKGTQKSQAPEEKPAPPLFANKGAEQPLVIQAREETAKGGHQGKQNVPKITFPTLLLTQTEAALCAHPLLCSAFPLQANPDSHLSDLFLLLAFPVSFLPPTSFPLPGAPWHGHPHAHTLLARWWPRSSWLEDTKLG